RGARRSGERTRRHEGGDDRRRPLVLVLAHGLSREVVGPDRRTHHGDAGRESEAEAMTAPWRPKWEDLRTCGAHLCGNQQCGWKAGSAGPVRESAFATHCTTTGSVGTSRWPGRSLLHACCTVTLVTRLAGPLRNADVYGRITWSTTVSMFV